MHYLDQFELAPLTQPAATLIKLYLRSEMKSKINLS